MEKIKGHLNYPPSAKGEATEWVTDPNKKKFKCNCKSTRCLKLYCECFANMEYCGPECRCCNNCQNIIEYEKERQESIEYISGKNKYAFQPKVFLNADQKSHARGCNCKRNNCKKNYCECFQAGVECTDMCRCLDCHNTLKSCKTHEQHRKRVKRVS